MDGKEREFFIVDAGSRVGGGGALSKRLTLFPRPHLQAGFYRRREGLRTETAQAADSHLGTGHSELTSIISIKHSQSSVPGQFPLP